MDNAKKIKIIEKIISICENAVFLPYNIRGKNHRFVRSRGLCFTIENFEMFYNGVIIDIFRELEIGNGFSSNYVMKFIDILISETLKKGIQTVKDDPLIIDIFEDEFQDVLIYIPLDGVNIEVNEIKIGKITLKMMGEEEINGIYNKIETLWQNNPYITEEYMDFLKIIKNVVLSFKDKPIAEFRIFADEDIAIDEAKRECEVVIDLLRFTSTFFHSKENTSIGFESEIKRGNYQMIVHKANFYGYKIPNEYKGPIFELEINESKNGIHEKNRYH